MICIWNRLIVAYACVCFSIYPWLKSLRQWAVSENGWAEAAKHFARAFPTRWPVARRVTLAVYQVCFLWLGSKLSFRYRNTILPENSLNENPSGKIKQLQNSIPNQSVMNESSWIISFFLDICRIGAVAVFRISGRACFTNFPTLFLIFPSASKDSTPKTCSWHRLN